MPLSLQAFPHAVTRLTALRSLALEDAFTIASQAAADPEHLPADLDDNPYGAYAVPPEITALLVRLLPAPGSRPLSRPCPAG